MTPLRQTFGSGSVFEATVGYARAVRVGPFVYVSGTTASREDEPVGGDDAGAQAVEVLRRIEGALDEAGATPADVVRTRVYLTDIADFAEVGRAHARFFADVRPTTTFVEVAALASPRLRVEIEADAVVGDGWPLGPQ